MPASSSSSASLAPDATLEALQEAFADAWEAAAAGAPAPSWTDFLPPQGQPCSPEFVLLLLQTDIEYRLKAGQTILSPELYFQHPRLLAASVVLDAAQQVEVIHWEYTQRWKGGERVRRQAYIDRFPHLAEALNGLTPRWTCPGCHEAGIPLQDEAAEITTCPGCARTVVVADLFAPPKPTPQPGPVHGLDPRVYELLEPLGHGGMGDVYRSRDPGLSRDLAIKVLKAEFRGHADAERRFQREAQIAGSLQHPGIAPVHNLGRLPDGRLCYTMKLVRGRTLAALLAEAGPGRAGRRLELLGIFESVCQAVAYAHSRGVVHRDLKPANVMVGEFGEVQVMDWGLAKVLHTTAAAEGAVEPLSGERHDSIQTADKPDVTREGQALGTLLYMAPEQARGEGQQLDQRADVFALGAMLCEVLTGDPPYRRPGETAPTAATVLRRAREQDLAEVLSRLDGCGADPELFALVKRMLAPAPVDRPSHAGEVAQEIKRHRELLEARQQQAETERAAEQAKAHEAERRAQAERRARRLTAGLAAAVVAVAGLGAGGGFWLQQKETQRQAEAARRAAELRQGVEDDLKTAAGLRDQGRWTTARQVLEQVRERLEGTGRDDLRQQREQLATEVNLLEGLEAARLQAATLQGEDFDYAGADRAYATTFAGEDLDLSGLPPDEAARRLRAMPVCSQVLTAVDDWASIKERLPGGDGEPLRAITRLADDDPWRQQLRDPALRKDPAELVRLARAPAVLKQPTASIILLSRSLEKQGCCRAAEELLRQAQERHPDDFWLNFDLANLLVRKKPTASAAAVSYYYAALACRPETAAVYNDLGTALYHQHLLPEAVAAYHKAIELQPRDTVAYNNLGNALRAQHQLAEAVAVLRKAIALKPDDAMAYSNLGIALREQHKLPEAVAAFRTAIEVQPDCVPAYYNLGIALREQGNLADAVAALDKATQLKPDYADAYVNLGAALRAQGKLPPAVDALRRATTLRPDDAAAYNNLGNALFDLRQLPEAVAAYRKAIKLKPDHPEPYYNVGKALYDMQQLPEAVAALHKAVTLKPNDAEAYFTLGTALSAQGLLSEAVAALRKAVALKPDYADAYCNLGNALYGQHQPSEAVAALRKAVGLKPDDAYANWNLGFMLQQQGQLAESLAYLKRGHEQGSRNPDWPDVYAAVVRRTERLLELDRKLPMILSGQAKPADAAEAMDLAWLCQQPYKQFYAAAVRLYSDAFAAEPKRAEDPGTESRYNAACAAGLAAACLGKDAAQLKDRHRAQLRQQALAWLRADLDAWTKQLTRGGPEARTALQQTMRHWQTDPDLGGLRDAAALGNLPADERAAWSKLWAEVQELREKAAARK
jgi:serine/threonine-protein kinase